MRDTRTRRDQTTQGRWRIFRFDGLLLVFLVVGWSLIFAAATLGLRRSVQQWLPVNLAPRVSAANYGVDPTEASRLAPVRPQIIEAVKQDALVARSSTPTITLAQVTVTPTPTPTPTPTANPPALVVSAGGPYTGKEGSLVAFIARATGSESEALTYRWDLDDDGSTDDAEGASVSFVFYDEGEYTISVQATDLTGRAATDVTTVSVSNVSPMINAGGDRSANEGEEIAFSATVRDPGHDVLLYYWDFGDGTGADGTLNPRHTYLDNGNYLVRLRAEDNDGGATEAFFITHVDNLPPIVDAGPDQVAHEGASVSFSGAAIDPGVRDTLTYAWDFDYDGRNFTPDAQGPTASAVYSDGPAAVVAALLVRDEDGGRTIDTANVIVGNVAPTIARVTNNGPVGEGSPLTLVVNATDVGSDTLTYAFDWENDGKFDVMDQLAAVSHIWYNQGSYTVGIRADDGDGGQVFTTTTVSAYNVAPIAVAGPEVVRLEGSLVAFDGSGSKDPGINDPLTYQWTFGDGSPTATGITVTHVYADNRVYSATLTVTDDSSAGGTDAMTVTILNANPIANAGVDRTVDEGGELNFTGTASDPGSADELTFAWDFDFDGINFEEDATDTSVNRTYLDGPVDYVVAFRVRDDDYPYPTDGGGEIGESIDTLRVTVDNVPPIVDAGGPYNSHPGQSVMLSGMAQDVPADVLAYEWDLDRNGTYDLTGQTVITAWKTAGVYTVTLRVTDDDGGFGLNTARVTIGNRLPTVDAGGPYTGTEGITVVLTGTGSDLDGDPLTYTWDLDYDMIFETPGRVVTYTWPNQGVYTVTLQGDDGWGGVVTDVATVTVYNMAPIAEAGGPYTVTVGIPATLTGSGTDVPSDTLTYAWDLDSDGSFEAPGRAVTYTWITTGTYMVVLQVDDGDGGVDIDTTTVAVNSLVPVAWLGVSYFLVRGRRAISWRRRVASKCDHSDPCRRQIDRFA